ncbi:MAG: exodeoxyribonuclease VII small subunit [Pseudomonadales bacterium]|nr:exodeoxyribonuclease VII small subunit [Pseudomonadales bacterium]
MSEQTPELPDFEATLAELTALVERMEKGNLTLDESLKAFERGITLTRTCQDALQKAELRVRKLTASGELTDLEVDDTLDD